MLAPTGTISFMMDCDTTGVEPDFSLVKSKKLVGGGEITIVNKTVPLGLEKLGYAPNEVDEIVAFIDERNTVVGAPYVKAEHYPVFDCAVGERAIHYGGHVKMMGAVQPFISGAISKTVNLPETATVDEVAQLWLDAWKLGVKAIAIYRDNCKVAQPLSGKKEAAAAPPVPLRERKRLPEDRTEVGRKFRVGDYEGYIHVGLYEDGTPGDIFVDIAKEGTTLAGLMNSLMISVSLGLQYGVPLEVYVSKFAHMRFEPSGMTNDADIRVAKSIVDYIFRWMGKKFLTVDQQEEIGILSPEVRARLAQRYANGGCPGRGRAGRGAAAGPDGAVQLLGGRGRVRHVRRPDDPHGLVLHVPRLRDEHRLQLAVCASALMRGAARRPSSFPESFGAEDCASWRDVCVRQLRDRRRRSCGRCRSRSTSGSFAATTRTSRSSGSSSRAASTGAQPGSRFTCSTARCSASFSTRRAAPAVGRPQARARDGTRRARDPLPALLLRRQVPPRARSTWDPEASDEPARVRPGDLASRRLRRGLGRLA